VAEATARRWPRRLDIALAAVVALYAIAMLLLLGGHSRMLGIPGLGLLAETLGKLILLLFFARLLLSLWGLVGARDQPAAKD
jgi:hypothetical protein